MLLELFSYYVLKEFSRFILKLCSLNSTFSSYLAYKIFDFYEHITGLSSSYTA